MKLTRVILASFLCLLGVQKTVAQQIGQQAAEKRDIGDIRTTAHVSEVMTIQEAFYRVISGTGVSGGLVTLKKNCSDDKPHEFHIPNGLLLRDALASLAATDKGHKWAVQDGVVLLLPVNGAPEILDTKISTVHLTDKTNLPLALDELLQTKEVRKAIAVLSLTVRPGEIGFQKLNGAASPHKAEPLDLNDVSLIGAINVLAREQGGAMWEFTQQNCGGHSNVRVEFTRR